MIEYTYFNSEKNGNLIDRNKLLESLENGMSAMDIVFLIMNAEPVDAVKVTRCKDCKKIGHCGEATNLAVMGFNGYCSRGKQNETD